MKCLIVLLITATVALAADDGLRAALSSPSKMVELYNNFKGAQHLTISGAEDSMRFRIFKFNVHFVADENEVEGETAHFGLNFMSTMTEAEKQSYLGLNVTNHLPNAPAAISKRSVSVPSEKLWTNEGKVTAVKNQGSCGSCWTYGAVGGLETRYASISGVLRNFAEQEYLDCVYPSRDGCQGGWPNDCYDYSASNGGRLASAAAYSYRGSDGSCRSSSHADAAVSAKITSHVAVASGLNANIAAMAEGAVSMAFEATTRFQSYSSGVFQDNTCSGRANHAVTGVGYTPTYIVIKNSWGSGWGDHGFVKVARDYNSNCRLFEYTSHAGLTATGAADSGPDAATTYNPHETDSDEVPVPENCENALNEYYCMYYDIYFGYCKYQWFVDSYCKKYCGGCDGGDDSGKDCASGTVRCDDGVCRHEHMC